MPLDRQKNLGELFEIEPPQWGLRGDPYLWRKMREYFGGIPLPATVAEFDRQFERAFEQLSGQPLSTARNFFVAEFAHGGMSSGGISPEFWRERVLPLLRDRYSRP